MRKHDTCGKQIGTLVCDLKVRLFGAHVIRLASHHFTFLVGQESPRLRDAEVGEFHVAFKCDHDVLEADVAMDNSERLAVLVWGWIWAVMII